jgi:hypothetical protein
MSTSSIYKKLLALFDSVKNFFNKTECNTDTSEELNLSNVSSNEGSLMFVLEGSNILILINIPDTSDKTSDEIVDLAENYANLIIHIANTPMHNDILNLLEQKIIDDDNVSNKLFIENVLSFAPILKNELEKQALSSYSNNTEPLVRPTSVFKYSIK